MIPVHDVATLACPRCRGALRHEGNTRNDAARGRVLADGHLVCTCGASWPVADGWCRMLEPEDVRGTDRLMHVIYDRLAPLHDPMVKVALPLCDTGTERELREAYLPKLELDTLPRDRVVRILEVGVGTGANVPLLRRALGGRRAEIWGVDLARGMIRICRRRERRAADVRLALADAHALPFRDGTFDRVFHVGATNNYRDPKRALAEMARVARPGTPVVVVDERLDPHTHHTVLHRAAFRAVCFYNPWPEDPVAALPEGARDVEDAQVARFFYCLSFRADAPAGG